jgi:hypothetical protein
MSGAAVGRVRALIGPEPHREGEYPFFAKVGTALKVGDPLVEQITYREQNMGTYGIGWFDVHAGGQVVTSVAAMAVAEIQYFPEGETNEQA